jgi:hypothetical protein
LEKPTLHLLDAGDDLTVEDLVDFYRALTGKEPTPEELQEAQVWQRESGINNGSKQA